MNLPGSSVIRAQPWGDWLSFRSLVLIAPVLMLTLKHWIDSVAFLTSIAAMVWLARNSGHRSTTTNELQGWRRWVAWALAGPILAVGLAQCFRGEFFLGNFDPPFRLLLCAPIFLAVSAGWLHRRDASPITAKWMAVVLPLTLVWTCCHRVIWPNVSWGPDRLTTSFVDPLTFGSLCLMFALLSLAGLWVVKGRSRLAQAFVLVSVASGLFLSVTSGSRTGWLSLPFFALLALYLGTRHAMSARLLVTIGLTCVLTIGVAMSVNPGPFDRLALGFAEVTNYNWHGMNPDGSLQMRISFWRMGAFYFMHRPLEGWGDLGWQTLVNSPELMVYASQYTREFASHGFHSEIMTSTVRSGVWGLISSISLFIVPLVCSLKLRELKHSPTMQTILWFMWIFLGHQFLAGLSTEVTALIFQASFFGLCVAVGMGEAMYCFQSRVA